MENNCNYSDNWQPYINDYDKFEYDVKLKDGTIVENCYPNGGKFNSISDLHNEQSFDETEVLEIRFSEKPRFGINENVSNVPQYEYLDRVNKPFILHNPYPPELKSVYEEKQFECKGKHQYRLVDTIKKEMGNGSLVTEIWKCQCGKVLGS
jgi:hypothetical protein